MDVNEITVVENKAAAPAEIIDFKAKAIEYLNSMGVKLPTKHMAQFMELAQAYQLNPFKREIYAVGYGDNFNIITGFEVYLKRAERSGLLDGWETEESGNPADGTLKSTITIYRKDRSHPFKHTVYYTEAVNKTRDKQTGAQVPNSVWAKMPIYMTKKVAMAQGFRLCFPDELAGMPYTADEINAPEEMPNKPTEKAAEAAPKKDAYKMNEAQSQLMRQMFAGDIFTDEEKQIYREALKNHERTAYEIIEEVSTIHAERQAEIQANAALVAEAFDK